MKIPPSTLQSVQGEPERNALRLKSRTQNGVESSQIIEYNIHKGSQQSKSGFLHNRVNRTLSRMNGDNSGSHNSNGIDGSRNSVQRSSLKRSDSYRRARTILSPDLSRNNRKSLEVAVTNNNSTVISKNLTNKSPSENVPAYNSPILASSSEPTTNGHSTLEKGKDSNKNNFFKNLRSQFSFSSLRVKKTHKKPITISAPLELNQTSDLKRRNSFSSVTVSNKSPQQPQMTSTPVSGCSTTNINNGELKKEKPNVKTSSEWPESPKTSMNTGVKFRTAALKNQHQRWSFAEQQQGTIKQCMPPQPNGTSYGCIYPNQYILAGHAPHGHNIYQHIHHHPHHHPVVSYGPIYGTCCPAAPNPVFVRSQAQRSSFTSLRGLTHDPACNQHILTKFEKPDEGAYGYSVSRSSSLSPPPKPMSDSESTGQLSQVSNSNSKSCECPMCYHSVKNPCNDCGCPSRTSTSSLKVNVKQKSPALTNQNSTPTFFSPSSDYYSLSPNSPPPEDLQLTQNGKGFPNSLEPQRPISATLDNKSQPCDEQMRNIDHSKKPELNRRSHGGRAHQDDNVYSRTPSAEPDKVSISVQHRSSIDPSKKHGPLERDLKSGRRHSWAGDKKVPVVQKQTSLTDFKKLLAQQATGQNPHRTSAKEMLQKSENEVIEPFYSSQKLGSSFRKRPSPRKDNRFAVIQEEIEGSRENLLNGKT